MLTRDILIDAFGRVGEVVHDAVEGLSDEELCYRVDSQANSIAWLIWHLTRVQDDHVSEVAGTEQAWVAAGWVQRFGLDLDMWDTGYGHKSEQVGMVRAGAKDLVGYYGSVAGGTAKYLAGLGDTDLDRIVDRRWAPPVTLAVRLVSVIADDLQHAGQAAFVRGLLLRRRGA